MIQGLIFGLTRIGWLPPDFLGGRKLLVLLILFAAMGVFWTARMRDSFAATPWGILAGYGLAIILLAVVATAARRYGIVAACLLSAPVTAFSLSLFSRSHAEITQQSELEPSSLAPYRTLVSTPDPSRGELKSRLNGYPLAFGLNGSKERIVFVNQGFARNGEEANANHLELLRYLSRKPDPRARLTFLLRYRYWALDKAVLVKIDDFQFANFVYMPHSPEIPPPDIRLWTVSQWLPAAPLTRIAFGMTGDSPDLR